MSAISLHKTDVKQSKPNLSDEDTGVPISQNQLMSGVDPVNDENPLIVNAPGNVDDESGVNNEEVEASDDVGTYSTNVNPNGAYVGDNEGELTNDSENTQLNTDTETNSNQEGMDGLVSKVDDYDSSDQNFLDMMDDDDMFE